MISSSAISAKHIQPPVNDQDFEIALVDIANHIFKSTTFERYGRKGSTQHGIDVRGRPNDETTKLTVIQGKCREPGKEENPDDVETHVRAALAKFEFQRFIYATTAVKKTALQDAADELQKTLNLELGDKAPLIQIWDWDSLTDMARTKPEVFRALDVQSAAVIALIEHMQVNDPDGLKKLSAIAKAGLSPSRSKLAIIEIKTIDENDKETPLTTLITEISERIPFEPVECFTELCDLLETEKPKEPIDYARIIGGLGNCHFILDERELAFEKYAEAYEYMPHRAATISNYALALGFQNKLNELRELTETALKEDASNSSLIARSLHFLKDLSIVPDAARRNAHVWLARLEITRRTDTKKSLRKATLKALKDHPDDYYIRQFYADTLLESVFEDEAALAGLDPLTPENHNQLTEALDVYASLWDETQSKGNYQQSHEPALPVNYMQALRVAGKSEQAIKIGLIAREKIQDASLALEYAINLVKSGRADELNDVVEELPQTADAQKMRLQHALDINDWNTVEALCDARLGDKDRDHGLLLGLKSLAQIESLEEKDRSKAVEKLIKESSVACREWTIRSQLARKYLGIEQALSCLASAKNCLGDDAEPEDIVSVVHQAKILNDDNTIIELLWERIDYSRPSEELELLLSVAATETPMRQRSIEIFSKLDETLLELAEYKELVAIAAFNQRNFLIAKKHFEELFNHHPHLRYWLAIYRCAMRLNDEAKIEELLNTEGVEGLPYSPLDSMQYASILKRHEKLEQAIQMAFRSVIDPKGQASPTVSGSYIGFVFSTNLEGPPSRIVEKGQYVKIRRSGTNEVVEGIIEGNDHRPWGVVLHKGDLRLEAALGKRIGDTFSTASKMGDNVEWIIEDVWPEYIRAAQYLSNEHPDRFGDAAIINRIVTDGENVEPILDMVRKDGEHQDDICRVVIEKNLPLALMGGEDGLCGLKLANAIRQRGYEIPTNQGTKEVQEEAANVAKNVKNGIVIDLFTAVTALELSILKPLAETLGPIRLSENELEQLLAHLDLVKVSKGDSFSLTAVEGDVYRDEKDKTFHKNQIEWLETAISDLRNLCEIEPVIYGDDKTDIEEIILKQVPLTLAPIELAKKHGVPLLSDDNSLRQLAKQLGVDDGLWLSASIQFALESQKLTNEQYLNATIGLAERKHDFLPVNSAMLVDAVEQTCDGKLSYEVKLLIDQLGGPSADIKTHAAVASSFMCALREKGIDISLRQEIMDNIARATFSDTTHRVAMAWASAFGSTLHPDDNDDFRKAIKKYLPSGNFNLNPFDKRPFYYSVSTIAINARLNAEKWRV